MRVLIAPDSFKGSLTAPAAAAAMERGVRKVFPNAVCDSIPMADGGEGTVDALVRATQGTLHEQQVRGPLGQPVNACWGLLGDGHTAVVEMAAASGLPLLRPEERDPRHTCTYGTGELIHAALQALHSPRHSVPHSGNSPSAKHTHPAKPRLIVGIGGSATNDGGAGTISALGGRFLDKNGKDLPPGGAALAHLARIDLSGLDPLLAHTEILVACDVDNPLCGERGSSAVFGPQKGATPAMVAELDAALRHFAAIAHAVTGKGMADTPGAGAAGGLGAGFLFFTDAHLRPGIDIVLEATDFTTRAAQADLVITGEGLTDFQTAYGKAPVGVAKAAGQHNKPVLCISGALGQGAEVVLAHGIAAVTGAVCSITTLESCMECAAPLLESAVERACRLVKVGMQMPAA